MLRFDICIALMHILNFLLMIFVDLNNKVLAQSYQIKTLGAMYKGYCVFLTTGEVKCWGSGEYGGLGSGSTNSIGDTPGSMGNNLPSLQFGTGFEVDEMSTGNYHGCVLSKDKNIKCWGNNNSGELGIGSTNNMGDNPNEMGDYLPFASFGNDSTPLHIYCNGGGTCVHFANNKVKCIGTNFKGAHGQGAYTIYGGSSTRIGDNIPYINIGTSRTVKSVHTSYIAYTVCVIMNNDALKCWGRNDYGQLGIGNTTSKGELATDMGDNLPEVDLGTGRKALSLIVGMLSVCAFLNNNEVVCWGRSDDGELALGTATNIGDQSGEMGLNIPTPLLGTGRTIKMSDGGDDYRCFVLDNNTVKCTGYGYYGRLGYEDSTQRGITNTTIGDFLPAVNLGTTLPITHIGAGVNSNCVVFNNVSIKCWGNGFLGRLGNERTASYGASPNTMGENLPYVHIGLPTTAPTKNPTASPTQSPSKNPSIKPTTSPSRIPTRNPTSDPSLNPTKNPSNSPTTSPTFSPTIKPSLSPSSSPTISPTRTPTKIPSISPTLAPTTNPSINPSLNPTSNPSLSPTSSPSESPTRSPTKNPTLTPTFTPSRPPSQSPVVSPTESPTSDPSKVPSTNPTTKPSHSPSASPTHHPTKSPTYQCDYQSAKLCKYDLNCMWVKVGEIKQCIIFDCTMLNKGKCFKERTKCKWNKKTLICNRKMK